MVWALKRVSSLKPNKAPPRRTSLEVQVMEAMEAGLLGAAGPARRAARLHLAELSRPMRHEEDGGVP